MGVRVLCGIERLLSNIKQHISKKTIRRSHVTLIVVNIYSTRYFHDKSVGNQHYILPLRSQTSTSYLTHGWPVLINNNHHAGGPRIKPLSYGCD